MKLSVPPDYQALDERSLPTFLSRIPSVAAQLGGEFSDWRVYEIGDGYLNLVFRVEGLHRSVCVKQAVPYVRAFGEDWPMTLERTTFQYQCQIEHSRYCESNVPRIYHYDSHLFLIVMEYLTPHITMRHGLLGTVYYPHFAEHISEYLARSLFFTSSLFLTSEEKKQKMAFFCGNTKLCKIMEDAVFTDPFWLAKNNKWTSPQLDDIAAEFRHDTPLKLAVSRLKLKHTTNAEALIHGDLHTGSIMLTPDSTMAIDQEYAFYGPMAFDVGNIIGNLLLNYFAQDGYATTEQPREEYQTWILKTVEDVWIYFYDKFISLWEQHPINEAYTEQMFADPTGQEALAQERKLYLSQIFTDALGFAGVEMIRRIIGFGHTIDLDGIENPDRRATCEISCLRLGRELAVNAASYQNINDVTATAQKIRH